jgi:hypothetical protein
MEMKLTFAPFVFSSGRNKLPLPYKAIGAGAYPPESLLASITPRHTDAVVLSRMSLSSLLYYALMGDSTATS